MAVFFQNRYPYTDFHELNLDWIISKIKEIKDAVKAADQSAGEAAESAAAAAGSAEAAADSAEDAADSAETAQNIADNFTSGAVNQYWAGNGAGIDPSWTDLPYVTPEMFGAVGDGVTDDTEAVQTALNDPCLHVVLSADYAVTSPLTVPNYKLVDGGGKIRSTSTCFELDGIAHVTIKDLKLYPTLHAIHITSDKTWTNYNVFSNIFCYGANTTDSKGLFIETVNSYINQQSFYDCVFWNFKYGIYCLNDAGSVEMAEHCFIRCSTESSKTAGQYIKNGNHFSFIDCRHGESISCIWITEGTCNDLSITGGTVVANTISNVQFSENTNGTIRNALRYSGIYANYPVRDANIVAGKVIPTYDTLTTSRDNVTTDRTVTYGQTLKNYYNFNTDVDCTLTLPAECYGGDGKINQFYVRTGKANNTSTVNIGTFSKTLEAGTHIYRFTFSTLTGSKSWLVETIS